ncbi:conjugative transposon protein TraM [Thalassobellus citreus]|uniref:conjugative transposon protein TraM n=1 Tax=Thalassobellus citreus TaxID=3367752 RepID=UPI00379845C0
MTIKKNEIVFGILLLCIVLFIGSYAFIILTEDEQLSIDNNQIPVPELEDTQKTYESKLEALNDLKEVRQTNAPSIYDVRLLDSTGTYDPDLLSKEKMHIVDSIYNTSRINYSTRSYRTPVIKTAVVPKKNDTMVAEEQKETVVMSRALGLEHQLFFASDPATNKNDALQHTDAVIYVEVDGTQIVKKNDRLQMRLIKSAQISSVVYPQNTLIYGVVSFKPNRTIINIENINHQPVKLKAFDFQDGSEGVYITNSFQEEARQEVVDDVVDDINIVGVPQVSGVKKLFQRNNRMVKVTITDNYQLILKPEL